MLFASPDTKPGTKILFNAAPFDTSPECWREGIVLGPNPKNTAHILVRDKHGRQWDTHWGNTRLNVQ